MIMLPASTVPCLPVILRPDIVDFMNEAASIPDAIEQGDPSEEYHEQQIKH